MTAEELAKTAEFAESIITSLAIVVGGVWSYMLFVKNRQKFPRGSVSHQYTTVTLPDGNCLVHLEVEIKNIGSVLISLDSAYTWIQQVVPVDQVLANRFESGGDPVDQGKQEIDWPLIQRRDWAYPSGAAELEPGEIQILDCDFLVPQGVEVIRSYTYVRNESKKERDIGWSKTSTIVLKSTETEDAKLSILSDRSRAPSASEAKAT